MNRLSVPALMLSSLLFFSNASAYTGDSAEVLGPRKLSASLNVYGLTTPGGLGIATFGIGTTKWLSICLSAGYGTADFITNGRAMQPYGGMTFKARISDTFGGIDQVSLLAGPMYHGHPGVSSAILLTTAHKSLQFYSGLDMRYMLDSGSPPPVSSLFLDFLVGMKIKPGSGPDSDSVIKPAFIFELGVPLTEFNDFTFGLGIQMLLNPKAVAEAEE